jgi:hypothetical protein
MFALLRVRFSEPKVCEREGSRSKEESKSMLALLVDESGGMLCFSVKRAGAGNEVKLLNLSSATERGYGCVSAEALSPCT